MCRLFALTTTDVPDPAFMDLMPELQQLSAKHPDGWGLAWYDHEGLRRERSTASAANDPTFLAKCSEAASPIIIAHIRKASKGGKSIVNTHPFHHGPNVFGHNGTILGMDKVMKGVPDEFRSRIEGRTDSEAMFHLLLWHIERTGDPIEGIKEGITQLRESYVRGTTAYNFVMSDGKRLFAYRESYTRHKEYDLLVCKNNGRVMFSSQPLGQERWESVPNGTLLAVGQGHALTRITF